MVANVDSLSLAVLFVIALFTNGVTAKGDDGGLLPPGAEVVGQEHMETLSDGMDDYTLLFDGKDEIKCHVYGADILEAPFTGEECIHWWLESYYEEDDARYHIITRQADSDLYLEVGDVFVEVRFPEHGFKPNYKKRYESGKQPEHFGSAGPEFLGYPEATYYEWRLNPGKEHKVTVSVFGGAYEVPEGVEYVTNYVFTFK
ncbi:MAG: hypothetical protein JSW52_03245 [Candidatus Coatesbacteria bacterium]|nr:MAG: hypothetical protein JSW52_03245 [Candidatus Coatesbacteria bacterium]